MPQHAKQQLQSRQICWKVSGFPGWQGDWSNPQQPEAEQTPEEVIAVTWEPEVVFSLDPPRRKAGPPPLPAAKRRHNDQPRDQGQQASTAAVLESELFSLSNLTKLNKGQLTEEFGRPPRQRRGPPPPPWARRVQAPVQLEPGDDLQSEAEEEAEALGALVRRSTGEFTPFGAGGGEVILAAGSWHSTLAPRGGCSWRLEATLLALGLSLVAVIGTLAALI